jgi:hypothetical protein
VLGESVFTLRVVEFAASLLEPLGVGLVRPFELRNGFGSRLGGEWSGRIFALLRRRRRRRGSGVRKESRLRKGDLLKDAARIDVRLLAEERTKQQEEDQKSKDSARNSPDPWVKHIAPCAFMSGFGPRYQRSRRPYDFATPQRPRSDVSTTVACRAIAMSAHKKRNRQAQNWRLRESNIRSGDMTTGLAEVLRTGRPFEDRLASGGHFVGAADKRGVRGLMQQVGRLFGDAEERFSESVERLF